MPPAKKPAKKKKAAESYGPFFDGARTVETSRGILDLPSGVKATFDKKTGQWNFEKVEQ